MIIWGNQTITLPLSHSLSLSQPPTPAVPVTGSLTYSLPARGGGAEGVAEESKGGEREGG